MANRRIIVHGQFDVWITLVKESPKSSYGINTKHLTLVTLRVLSD
jgi:hypothetical protein